MSEDNKTKKAPAEKKAKAAPKAKTEAKPTSAKADTKASAPKDAVKKPVEAKKAAKKAVDAKAADPEKSSSNPVSKKKAAEKAGSAKAICKKLRVSPQKLNLLARQIRGKRVELALHELSFSRKRSAIDVKKTLMSAIANAENNHGLDVDRLVVGEAYVGHGFSMRRFRPRAKGRAAPIHKFFSHLTVVVTEQEV